MIYSTDRARKQERIAQKLTWGFGFLTITADHVALGRVNHELASIQKTLESTGRGGSKYEVSKIEITLTFEMVPFSSTSSGALLLTGTWSVSSWQRQQKRLWKMPRLRGFFEEDAACGGVPGKREAIISHQLPCCSQSYIFAYMIHPASSDSLCSL